MLLLLAAAGNSSAGGRSGAAATPRNSVSYPSCQVPMPTQPPSHPATHLANHALGAGGKEARAGGADALVAEFVLPAATEPSQPSPVQCRAEYSSLISRGVSVQVGVWSRAGLHIASRHRPAMPAWGHAGRPAGQPDSQAVARTCLGRWP